jgi:para-aminobenzoate synthetase component II
MLLVIDNYDSFVHNLARYFRELGQTTVVVRNDHVDLAALIATPPHAIILSPGPQAPQQAGQTLEVINRLAGRVPMLGVCLGHQAIGHAFGGTVVVAQQPMHGRSSRIRHQASGLFAGLPSPMEVGRYHSLAVELPPTDGNRLTATAWAEDGTIMALEHRDLPLYGVQFHPESILTEQGYVLLANFLRLAGLESSSERG